MCPKNHVCFFEQYLNPSSERYPNAFKNKTKKGTRQLTGGLVELSDLGRLITMKQAGNNWFI